jgi:signal transduction histidine kinase
VLGFTAGCAVFFAFAGSPWWKSLVFDVLFLVLFGLPVWDGWRRAQREPGNRWAWRALALGCLIAGLGTLSLLVSLFRQGTHVAVPPRTVFALWVLSSFLIGVGFFQFLRQRHEKLIRMRAAMDAVISALALFLLIWSWFLEDLLAKSNLPGPDEVMVVAYFVTIAANLGLTGHLLTASRTAWRGPIGVGAAMCLALVLLLPTWVEAMLMQTYHQAHPARLILLPAWLFCFLTFRARWPRIQDQPGRPTFAIQDMIPYVPVLLATAFVGATYLKGDGLGHRTGLALFLVLAVIVMLRQLVALRDVRDLSQNLEAKVEVRTRDLAASQNLILQTQRMNLVASLGAGLVHDANNLIGAAKAYAQLIQYSLEDNEPIKAEGMLRQLMDFARTGDSTAQALDVNEQVAALEPLLRIVVPKDLRLKLDLHANPLRIQADPAQIDQVIVNLVGNARDATPAGGHITIRTTLRSAEPAPRIDLIVQDSGSGMPPEVIARIFDAFFTTKPPGKGTGLGLSSVKAVVEGLGGTLEVESEPGRGTAIHVLLPQAPERTS